MRSALEVLKENHEEMKSWFYALHKKPQVAFEEVDTAKFIADKLREWGYEVHEKIGQTGVVATMSLGDSNKAIGLRADMDALPIQEVNDLHYKSQIDGKSHLCGHDGHSIMLLAAAKYLAETKNFNGRLCLIFQPAEETMCGGTSMLEAGLFERWPVDAVYGMHNIPGLEKGKFYFRDGETMSAVDLWEIELTGKGCHGSMPEKSIDPVVAGASLVMALQSIVSRNVSPWDNAVVTIGAFLAGETNNVIPQTALLRLSMRNMQPDTREQVLQRIREITRGQAESYNCTYEIRETTAGAVLVNSREETSFAAEVARKTFGEENVIYPVHAYMASEDFAFMLQQKPGTYCMLGNGDTQMVHHPEYVFDLDILPVGAAYWVALAEDYLKK